MSKKKYVTRGISWKDPELLKAAQRRADDLGISTSDYVTRAVKQDLTSRPDPVLAAVKPIKMDQATSDALSLQQAALAAAELELAPKDEAAETSARKQRRAQKVERQKNRKQPRAKQDPK